MRKIAAWIGATVTILLSSHAQAGVSLSLYYRASVTAPEMKESCESIRPGSTADINANLPAFLQRHAAEIQKGRTIALASHPKDPPELVDGDTYLVEMNKFADLDDDGQLEYCKGLVAFISGKVPDAEQPQAGSRPAVASVPPAQAPAPAPAPAAARAFNLSNAERDALAPLQKALDAHDWAKAAALLPAAERGARGPDAVYVLGQLQLQLGIGTKDETMQAKAVDTLLASKAAQASELPELYRNQGALALSKNPPDRAKAAAAYEKLVELSPRNAEAKVLLAKLRNEMGKPQQALDLMVRAINAERAAKHDVDQSWYLYALKIAYENHVGPDAVQLSQDLYGAYPSPEHWRDSLLVYRELGKLDNAALLDVLRLQRATGALAGERDWYDFASAAQAAGFPGEARAALDEGLKSRAFDPAKPAFAKLISAVDAGVQSDRAALAAEAEKAAAAPTGVEALRVADAYFGYGDYAKAIAAYRVAQSKPGVDANRVKLHLGVALTLSGDRTQSESMLGSVVIGSYGPTAEIAARWLTWLRLAR